MTATTTDAKRDLRRVLVVDDDHDLRELLGSRLASAGFVVTTTETVEQAIAELSRARHDAALVDVRLRDGSGHRVLARARTLEDPPVVIMMSGYADVTTVVATMRDGAADFLEKPLESSALVACLERAIARSSGPAAVMAAPSVAPEPTLVASARSSPDPMRDVLTLVDKIAATPTASALLIGESGAGKDVLATRIHELSDRRDRPFVRVNVAAIPSSIFQAELFGSVKGAFTDARTDRAGHLKSADGGTILLDEIGELGVDDQAKLLRVLEERRFFPVGSDHEQTIDVRIIAATNRDPDLMMREGRLRPDLFYRLGTVVAVPSLRERANEILPLAQEFVATFCAEFRRPLCRLAPAAAALLESYSWPGNIRQLRNVIERAVMLTDGDEIGVEAFELIEGAEPGDVSRSRRRRCRGGEDADMVERAELVKALALSSTRSNAARALGIARSTFYAKLKRHNL